MFKVDEFNLGEMIGEIRADVRGIKQIQTDILDKFPNLPCSDHDTRIRELSAPKKISIETLKAIPHIGKIITFIATLAGTAYAAFKG